GGGGGGGEEHIWRLHRSLLKAVSSDLLLLLPPSPCMQEGKDKLTLSSSDASTPPSSSFSSSPSSSSSSSSSCEDLTLVLPLFLYTSPHPSLSRHSLAQEIASFASSLLHLPFPPSRPHPRITKVCLWAGLAARRLTRLVLEREGGRGRGRDVTEVWNRGGQRVLAVVNEERVDGAMETLGKNWAKAGGRAGGRWTSLVSPIDALVSLGALRHVLAVLGKPRGGRERGEESALEEAEEDEAEEGGRDGETVWMVEEDRVRRVQVGREGGRERGGEDGGSVETVNFHGRFSAPVFLREGGREGGAEGEVGDDEEETLSAVSFFG
ncbi:plk protein kinase, partial [Nannochloropsis oceanica]